MSELAEKTEPKLTIPKLVRECLEQSDGNERAAAALIKQRLTNEPELKEALFEPFLEKAVWAAIRHQRKKLREQFHIVAGNTENYHGLISLAQRHAIDLLNFPLPSGQRLGDATSDNLDEAIRLFTGMARGNVRNAKFLGKVKTAMGNAEHVQDVLDHSKILKLQMETDND